MNTPPPISNLPDDVDTIDLELIQADIDDDTPEVLGAVLDSALAAGALDAVCVPLVMKKSRPGVRLEILVHPENTERLAALILRETTSLGLRRLPVKRHGLARRVEEIIWNNHVIRVKLGLWNGRPIKAKPEFEDCRAAAAAENRALRDVLDWARQEAARFLEQ